MAIKPSELETLSEGEVAILKDAEREIDESLRDPLNKSDNGSYFIDVPDMLDEGNRVYLALVKKYEAAGWSIQYETAEFAEDFLIFTPRQGGNQLKWRQD